MVFVIRRDTGPGHVRTTYSACRRLCLWPVWLRPHTQSVLFAFLAILFTYVVYIPSRAALMSFNHSDPSHSFFDIIVTFFRV